MDRNTIEKILNFLEEKEGKEVPNKWFESIKLFNLIQKLENHPDRTQYKHRGHLDLNRSTIKKLPNKLHVVGRLTLSNCKQLTKLPNDLYVGQSMWFYYSNQISELPTKLYVGGNLDLSKTNITKLPDNLYVGYDLELNALDIVEIPNNLYVGRNLLIYNTPLANKYTNEEIKEIVASTGGQIIGDILRI